MSRIAATSLARTRIARGLTQKELAAILGIARTTLSNVENGHVRPWPRLRITAARVLGVHEDDLFEPLTDSSSSNG